MSGHAAQADWLARAQSAAPLVLAAGLAVFTWWLVESAPGIEGAQAPQAVSNTPDHELFRARLARFDAEGRLEALLDGERMRHLPVSQSVQIDVMRVAMRHPDGRRLLASAREGEWSDGLGMANLVGQADVRLADAGVLLPSMAAYDEASPGVTRIQGERLDLDTRARVLTSQQPVTVQREGSVLRALTLRHDASVGLTELGGRVQGRLVMSSP
jgi:lipopolysaccharide export system protein LptC